jgi:hypothetical protein
MSIDNKAKAKIKSPRRFKAARANECSKLKFLETKLESKLKRARVAG